MMMLLYMIASPIMVGQLPTPKGAGLSLKVSLLKKRVKRDDPNKRARIVAWVLLFIIIGGAVYFVAQPSSRHNQCENLPSSFTIMENGKPVEVQIGLADVEVSTTGLTLYPFTVDGYGHKTYETPQVAYGTVLLNPLDTIQDLKGNYVYSAAHFPTSKFYRGSITTEGGTIPDALYFIERTEVAYVNCSVRT